MFLCNASLHIGKRQWLQPLAVATQGGNATYGADQTADKLFRFDEGATRELSSNQGALITRSRWRPMRRDPGLATAAAQFRLEFDLLRGPAPSATLARRHQPPSPSTAASNRQGSMSVVGAG